MFKRLSILYRTAQRSSRGGNMKVLLVSVPVEVREQVEALLDPKRDQVVVGETCREGACLFCREKPDIVVMNGRTSDNEGLSGPCDSRSLVGFLRKEGGSNIIAVSPFLWEKACLEALGCTFCRPENVGETLQLLLLRQS